MDVIRIKTYSKRKLKYELLDLFGFLFFLSIFILAIGQKTKIEFIERNSSVFITLFIIGFIWIIARLILGRMKWFKPIESTGEIEFSDSYLYLKGEKIELKDIRRIRIDVTQCKGLPAGGRSGISDGTGNYIEIFLKNNTKFKERIFIEREQQRENLKAIMEVWKQSGVMIIGVWKPFLHI